MARHLNGKSFVYNYLNLTSLIIVRLNVNMYESQDCGLGQGSKHEGRPMVWETREVRKEVRLPYLLHVKTCAALMLRQVIPYLHTTTTCRDMSYTSLAYKSEPEVGFYAV